MQIKLEVVAIYVTYVAYTIHVEFKNKTLDYVLIFYINLLFK